MPTAILLIAHGSRVPEANADLEQLAELLASRRSGDVVEAAYLELAEPTIPQGMQRCVERGADTVLMMPYFLSAGAHASGDLERHRQKFAAEHPAIDVRLCLPLGVHPLMVEIILDRIDEAKG